MNIVKKKNRDRVSCAYFDESTATIRIVKTDDFEAPRSFAATPLIMNRSLKRKIRNGAHASR